MRAVHRNADTATHDDAVDQCDIGLAEILDRGVERIFVAPELQGVRLALGFAEIVQMADVATSGESALAIGHDDDARDRVVVGPGGQLRAQGMHHAMRHRIERLRPVQRDNAGRAAALEEYFGFAHVIAHK